MIMPWNNQTSNERLCSFYWYNWYLWRQSFGVLHIDF